MTSPRYFGRVFRSGYSSTTVEDSYWVILTTNLYSLTSFLANTCRCLWILYRIRSACDEPTKTRQAYVWFSWWVFRVWSRSFNRVSSDTTNRLKQIGCLSSALYKKCGWWDNKTHDGLLIHWCNRTLCISLTRTVDSSSYIYILFIFLGLSVRRKWAWRFALIGVFLRSHAFVFEHCCISDSCNSCSHMHILLIPLKFDSKQVHRNQKTIHCCPSTPVLSPLLHSQSLHYQYTSVHTIIAKGC